MLNSVNKMPDEDEMLCQVPKSIGLLNACRLMRHYHKIYSMTLTDAARINSERAEKRVLHLINELKRSQER